MRRRRSVSGKVNGMKTTMLLALSLLAAGVGLVAVAPTASACEVDLDDTSSDVKQCANEGWAGVRGAVCTASGERICL